MPALYNNPAVRMRTHTGKLSGCMRPHLLQQRQCTGVRKVQSTVLLRPRTGAHLLQHLLDQHDAHELRVASRPAAPHGHAAEARAQHRRQHSAVQRRGGVQRKHAVQGGHGGGRVLAGQV